MDLRRGRPDDLSFVFASERRYIQDLEPDSFARWQESLGRHLDQWVDALPRMTIAENEDRRIGYLFWEGAAGKAVLASVGVDPAYRRNGVASLLMKRFEDEARSAGFSVAELGFVSHNPARFLYERLGYRPAERAERYVLLAKDL